MIRYFITFFVLFLAIGCKTTTDDALSFPPTPPFGQTIRASSEAMIQNAQQQNLVLGIIHFDNGKAILNYTAQDSLNRIAQKIATTEGSVIIEGHADLAPFEKDGDLLAKQRAEAVSIYLQSAGVWKKRLVIHNFADTRPAKTENMSNIRNENQRVEIKIYPQGEGMTGKDAIKASKISSPQANTSNASAATDGAAALPAAAEAATPAAK